MSPGGPPYRDRGYAGLPRPWSRAARRRKRDRRGSCCADRARTRDKAALLFLVFEERLRDAVEDGFRTLPADVTLNEQVLHLFKRLFTMYGESVPVARQFVKEFPGAEGPNADRVNGLTFAFLQRM